MKKLFAFLCLCIGCIVSAQAQEETKRNENDPISINVDPISKLAPSKKEFSADDSIAVMSAEEVAITASKRDAKKAHRLLKEQAKVGELTRELIEEFKFQFEPYYCRYKTEYRSEGFIGAVRCYGGRFVTSLAPIPLNNQEYREFNTAYYGDPFGSGHGLVNENSYNNFTVEDIHEDPENEDQLLFDVVINAPIIVDGRTEYHLRYNFTLNYKNGKMACAITGEHRKYAFYYGYLTDLR